MDGRNELQANETSQVVMMKADLNDDHVDDYCCQMMMMMMMMK